MRTPVDFEREYGPHGELPDEEPSAQALSCPFCGKVIEEFTFLTCEPQQICSKDGILDLDADEAENRELDVTVRCDHCLEFLPRSYYCPMGEKMKGIVDAAHAATD